MIKELLTDKRTRIIAGFVFLFLTAAIGFYAYRFNRFYKKIYVEQPQTTPKPKKTKYNILLLGYGGKGHDGAYLTDTIILAHVDIEKKKVVLISIPRDLWVKVPTKTGYIFSKINALYQMGLFPEKFPFLKEEYKKSSETRLLTETIERITGLKTDYFVAVDFQGFKKAIDVLGGVKVYLEKPLDDYQYPIEGKEKDLCGKSEEELPELEKLATKSPVLAFPCRYEHFHLDAGWNELDGETALKFVRSRHAVGEKGDFGRAKRQQILLKAVGEKILDIGFVTKIPSLLTSLEDHIRTDVPLRLVKENLKELYNFRKYKIKTVVISTDNFLKDAFHPQGGYILLPKEGEEEWRQIKTYVQNVIEGITPTPEKENTE